MICSNPSRTNSARSAMGFAPQRNSSIPAAVVRLATGAPPVCRPNTTVQSKLAGPGIGGAPPVYKPNTIAQSKVAGPAIGGAPPVYRPNTTAQTKLAGPGTGGAPPVYKPNTIAQTKVPGPGLGAAPPVYRPDTTPAQAKLGRGTQSSIAARSVRMGRPPQGVLQARVNPIPPSKSSAVHSAPVVPYALDSPLVSLGTLRKFASLAAPVGRSSSSVNHPNFAPRQHAVTGQLKMAVQRMEADKWVRPADFDSPPWTYTEDWEISGPVWREKEQLLEKVYKVVELAKRKPETLGAVMDHDKVYDLPPAGQLEYCVQASRGWDAGTLAKCLYTSYFYQPINKYLRNPSSMDTAAKEIRELIEETINVLKLTVSEDTRTYKIKNKRVELQAEWIGDPKVGDILDFPAFTSTHRPPDMPAESTHPKPPGALSAMLPDIGKGTFGKVTKVAVLEFTGNTKLLQPVTKYFDNEKEDIIPPGTRAKIVDIKTKRKEYKHLEGKEIKKYTLEFI